MPATGTRRVAVTGGLALALTLLTPALAQADPPADPGGEGKGGGQGQGLSQAGRGQQPGGSSSSQGGGQGRTAGQSSQGAGKGARTSGKKAGHRRTSDPRGNNGTIKIDGLPFDDGRGDEPHVGCTFRIVFWGFETEVPATGGAGTSRQGRRPADRRWR